VKLYLKLNEFSIIGSDSSESVELDNFLQHFFWFKKSNCFSNSFSLFVTILFFSKNCGCEKRILKSGLFS
jgi:hypothetical protein